MSSSLEISHGLCPIHKAYSEWYRVLKPQGILLNFDADYGNEQFYQTKIENLPLNHAHRQVKPTLMQECDLIKNSLEISSKYVLIGIYAF